MQDAVQRAEQAARALGYIEAPTPCPAAGRHTLRFRVPARTGHLLVKARVGPPESWRLWLEPGVADWAYRAHFGPPVQHRHHVPGVLATLMPPAWPIERPGAQQIVARAWDLHHHPEAQRAAPEAAYSLFDEAFAQVANLSAQGHPSCAEPAALRERLVWLEHALEADPPEPTTLVHGGLRPEQMARDMHGTWRMLEWDSAMRAEPLLDLVALGRALEADGPTLLSYLEHYCAQGSVVPTEAQRRRLLLLAAADHVWSYTEHLLRLPLVHRQGARVRAELDVRRARAWLDADQDAIVDLPALAYPDRLSVRRTSSPHAAARGA